MSHLKKIRIESITKIKIVCVKTKWCKCNNWWMVNQA